MRTGARVVLAIALVVGLGAALVGPIVGSDDAEPTVAQHRDRSTESPDPSPSATPTEPETDRGALPTRLVEPYPRKCLKPVDPPELPGRIAAFQGGRVTIGTPTGEVITKLPASLPIGWSPSGKYLATGDGLVLTEKSDPRAVYDYEPIGRWGWSPIADCLVGVRDGELVVSDLNAQRGRLLANVTEEFAFSPDGGRLIAILERGRQHRVVMLDLARGVVKRVSPRWFRTDFDLRAWSSDGRFLFFNEPLGPSLGADGAELLSIGPKSNVLSTGVGVLPHGDFLETCGERLLAVAGFNRDSSVDKRLALVEVRGRPIYLTSREETHVSPSCSNNGQFIATARSPAGQFRALRELVILDSTGNLVRDLRLDGYYDASPDWGSPGAGLVFARTPESGPSQIWFAPEGGAPIFTGLTTRRVPRFYAYAPAFRFYDWSATSPSGMPAR